MTENEKLKLLAGLPFQIFNVKIKPLTLLQIADIGYEQYNLYLTNLIANPQDFNLVDNIDILNITTWDIIVSNMYHGTDEYRSLIIEALQLFFQEKVIFLYCKGYFYIGKYKNNKIINRDNYEDIKRILKIQNCINTDEFKEQFANAKAKEIYMKIMKGRQSIEKDQSKINFDDLISVLAANSNNLNILNIWKLTLFQFNNQFARMQMIEDYDINIRSLLAGAKPEDIKLQHYIRAIENDKGGI